MNVSYNLHLPYPPRQHKALFHSISAQVSSFQRYNPLPTIPPERLLFQFSLCTVKAEWSDRTCFGRLTNGVSLNFTVPDELVPQR